MLRTFSAAFRATVPAGLGAKAPCLRHLASAPQMRRVAFQFKATSDPELQVGYKEAHKNVWPEMKEALARNGWHNYSLFMKKDGTLFGYFETDRSLQECLDGMAEEPINTAWQEAMGKYFPDQEINPDESMVELEEVMHLDI